LAGAAGPDSSQYPDPPWPLQARRTLLALNDAARQAASLSFIPAQLADPELARFIHARAGRTGQPPPSLRPQVVDPLFGCANRSGNPVPLRVRVRVRVLAQLSV